MKKNVAGQKVGCQLTTAADGSEFTGSVTVYVTGDAGTQAVGSVGSGACTHEGHGYHTYAPSQAETNYDLAAFTFVGSGAITATVQVYTTFPQTGDNYARLGAPAGASVSADIAAVKTDTAAVKAKTDNLPSDPADESLVIAATDAIAALIGSPAGASVSADVAAVKSDTAAIKIYADRTVARGTVSGTSPTTTSFTSSALSPAGVDADQFKGRIIVFDNDTTTTALRGQATDITANTGASNPQFTFSALTTAPQSGDTFSIV